MFTAMLAWPRQEEDMPLAVHFKDSSPQVILVSWKTEFISVFMEILCMILHQ